MQTNRSFLGRVCRFTALSFLAAGTASLLQAQQPSFAPPTSSAPLLIASDSAPSSLAGLGLASSSASSSSSSSVSSDLGVDSNGQFMLNSAALDLSSAQPPPRRYGRPNYSTAPKYTFLGGVGLTLPVGDTHYYETPSWGLQVGFGPNFGKNFSVPLQFDYDHFGLQAATIDNEGYIYNYCTAAEFNAGDCAPEGPAPAGTATPIDGNNHVWSFTLDPTFTLSTEGSMGAYLVAGGGFYHKVTNFTTPTVGQYCYVVCEEVETNSTFDHYTSNAPGVDGGIGLTYKFSRFSNERLYMEARYVLILDSSRAGVTAENVASSSITATDFYPANSHRTTYIPIKFGIRF